MFCVEIPSSLSSPFFLLLFNHFVILSCLVVESFSSCHAFFVVVVPFHLVNLKPIEFTWWEQWTMMMMMMTSVFVDPSIHRDTWPMNMTCWLDQSNNNNNFWLDFDLKKIFVVNESWMFDFSYLIWNLSWIFYLEIFFSPLSFPETPRVFVFFLLFHQLENWYLKNDGFIDEFFYIFFFWFLVRILPNQTKKKMSSVSESFNQTKPNQDQVCHRFSEPF